jgi:hypothetical protein
VREELREGNIRLLTYENKNRLLSAWRPPWFSDVFPNRKYKPKSHGNKAGAFTEGDACEPSTGSLNAIRLRMENLRQHGNKN